MANDIVSGLFGPSPDDIRRQQYAQMQANALAASQMDSAQQAKYSYNMAGGQLGMLARDAMGMPNPKVQEAQQQQAMIQGVDFHDPKSIRERALQIQDPKMKFQLEALARQAELEQSALGLQQAQAAHANAQATDIPTMRKEQIQNQYDIALSSLQQKADLAKQASEDKRLSREQQAELAKQHNELLLTIANMKSDQTSQKPMTAAQQVKFEKQLAGDFKSAEQVMQNSQNIVQSISDISGSKGLSARTGYTGYAPAWMQGKEAMTAQNRIDTLKGKVTQMGKSMATMSGAIGPMAVQEWKIVSDAVNAIDPTAGNFNEQLANVQAQAEGTGKRIKDMYDRQYSDYFEKYPKFHTQNLKTYSADGNLDKPQSPTTDAGYENWKKARGLK